MNCFKAEIISNKKIAQGHYVLSFKSPKIAKSTKPGQFFNIRVSDSYEPLLRRPFSAHKIGKGKIEILYKAVGKATGILSTKKKGDVLDIIGPLGNGFEIRVAGILVAGGHGVAPLFALAEKLKIQDSRLKVFIGARTKEHVVCDKELRKLGARVCVATEDGSKGYRGLITDLLLKKLRTTDYGIRNTIYACGPKPMLKAVAKIAGKYKLACQISMEEYMGCGTGICMGCTIKTSSGNKLVCKDGPVFDAREIIW